MRPTRTFAREMPVFDASGIRSKYIRFQWFAEAEGELDRLPKEAWDAKADTRSGNFIWFGSDSHCIRAIAKSAGENPLAEERLIGPLLIAAP